jgi:hypothetical protein
MVLAHERRDIGSGKYVAVVGWDREPAFQNQLNAASFRITTKDGDKPVEGLEKTLKASIAFGGGQAREFPLETVFGQPGYYVAHVMPTKEGSYIFTLSGMIEGAPINEQFESGPGRFDDVDSAAAIQFPQALPDPSAAAADIQAARAEAASARTLGIAGIVVGGLGLLAALASFALRRPGAPAATARPVREPRS